MRKFCLLSVFALTLVCLSQQQASAYHKFNFGVGLNLGYEGGNNNFMWGLFRSGDRCGPPAFGPHFWKHHRHVPVYVPSPHHHHRTHAHPVPHAPAPHAPAPHAAQAPRSTATPASATPQSIRQAYYQQSYYNYQAQSNGYYAPSYYNYPVPSYWYGR